MHRNYASYIAVSSHASIDSRDIPFSTSFVCANRIWTPDASLPPISSVYSEYHLIHINGRLYATQYITRTLTSSNNYS